MLNRFTKAAAAGALVMSLAAAPLADARTYHHSRYYYAHHNSHHARQCRNTGTVAGVVVGGLLGNAITHHSAVGTVVGAGVGGVAGHQIARHNCRR